MIWTIFDLYPRVGPFIHPSVSEESRELHEHSPLAHHHLRVLDCHVDGVRHKPTDHRYWDGLRGNRRDPGGMLHPCRPPSLNQPDLKFESSTRPSGPPGRSGASTLLGQPCALSPSGAHYQSLLGAQPPCCRCVI